MFICFCIFFNCNSSYIVFVVVVYNMKIFRTQYIECNRKNLVSTRKLSPIIRDFDVFHKKVIIRDNYQHCDTYDIPCSSVNCPLLKEKTPK